MSALEPVPAIRRIGTSRSGLTAFDIVGHVSPADVENLFGLLEAAYALEPRVDILLRLIEIDGVDWDEVAPDTISDGKRHAAEHVRRCAIVGIRHGRAAARGFFLEVEPVEFREFDLDEEGMAWAWVDGLPLG
jgi:SpoIIAA-like